MKNRYITLIGIVVVLIAIRLVLPSIILRYANKFLASSINGYYGHIDDIDLSIYRGAYSINNIYLDKVDSVSQKQTDFFRSRGIDLSVEWAALLHGSISGELIFDSPALVFTKDKAEIKDVKNDTTDFRKLLKGFMPLKINRFEINNGSLHYVDYASKPKVDIALKQAHILAENLSNVTDEKVELPSSVSAQASLYEGTLDFKAKLNVLTENATFDMNTELKNTNLALLNDFFKAYGNFDVEKGNFGLYTEIAAKEGKFKGYVKPVIKDLDVVGQEDRNNSFFHKVWESLVGAVGVVFKNQKKDQLATKIPLEGNFENPRTNTLEAIWEVLQNAFIQALMPSIDNEININSVKEEQPEDKKNILQKIFSSKKNEDEKKGEKEDKTNDKKKDEKKDK